MDRGKGKKEKKKNEEKQKKQTRTKRYLEKSKRKKVEVKKYPYKKGVSVFQTRYKWGIWVKIIQREKCIKSFVYRRLITR